MILRLFMNLLTSFFAHHLVHFLVPSIPFSGPKLHTTLINGIICEFLCTFFGTLIIYFACFPPTKFSSKMTPPVLIGLGFRLIFIIEGGKYTGIIIVQFLLFFSSFLFVYLILFKIVGACMNPLWAIAWEFFRDSSNLKLNLQEQIFYCFQFFSVYIFAPTFGASIAAILYTTLQKQQTQQKQLETIDRNKKID